MDKLFIIDSKTEEIVAVLKKDGNNISIEGQGVFRDLDAWIGYKQLSFEEVVDLIDPYFNVSIGGNYSSESFKSVDFTEQANSYYKKVYSIDEKAFRNLLGGRKRGQGGFSFGKRKRRGKKFGRGLAGGFRKRPKKRSQRDGDGDGLIDDDTIFERPAGTDILSELADAPTALGARNDDLITPNARRLLGAEAPEDVPSTSQREREERIAARRRRAADRAGRTRPSERRRRGYEGRGADRGTAEGGAGGGGGGRDRVVLEPPGNIRNDQREPKVGRKTTDGKKVLGPRDDYGYGYPTPVELGTSNMWVVDDAVKHLESGGDLREVPDELLAKAILSLASADGTKRFRTIGEDENESLQLNVNDVILVEDTFTNQLYGVKFATGEPAFAREDLAEIVGANLAERLGFAQGVWRWGGPDDKRGTTNTTTAGMDDDEVRIRPLVFELAPNYAGEGEWQQVATWSYREQEDVPYDQLAAMVLLDFALLNIDRHGNNVLWQRDPRTGKVNLTPIDHGIGLNGPKDESIESIDPNFAGFMSFLAESHAGSVHLKLLKEKIEYGDGREVAEALKQFQKNLRDSIEESSLEEFIDNIARQLGIIDPYGLDEYPPELNQLMARIQWLLTTDTRDMVDAIENWKPLWT